MKLGFSTGYQEEYWAGWPWCEQYGGTENMLIETAVVFAAQGHEVWVRLPRKISERTWRGVHWVSDDFASLRFDILFAYDDFAVRDHAGKTILVACRSDPPQHKNFDDIVFFSMYQARLLGCPEAKAVGGGVDLEPYRTPIPRIPRRVISTSSPDRCPAATAIGSSFDFIQTYKPVGGVGTQYSREALVNIQKSAMVQAYPLDPVRPSDFFSMSVLEAMAAGTPVIVSDADCMPEVWGDTAWVLPRPVDLAVWSEAIERLLTDRALWKKYSLAGKQKARELKWEKQAAKFLTIALS